jgi:hypothetical protein
MSTHTLGDTQTLWVKWSVTVGLGYTLAPALAALIMPIRGTQFVSTFLLMGSTLSGVLIGLGQWVILRSRVTRAAGWFFVTIVGFALGDSLALSVNLASWGTTVRFLILGLCLGWWQAFAIRLPATPFAFWIITNGLGWALAANLGEWVVDRGGSNFWFFPITGLVAGLITGAMMTWILKSYYLVVDSP